MRPIPSRLFLVLACHRYETASTPVSRTEILDVGEHRIVRSAASRAMMVTAINAGVDSLEGFRGTVVRITTEN